MTSLTFIDTNKLPRVKTPQGEVTEILNQRVWWARRMCWGCCAGFRRAKSSRPRSHRNISFIYLMEGKASIRLDNKDYERRRAARASIWGHRRRPPFARRTAGRRSCFIWWSRRFPVSICRACWNHAE